MSAFTKICLLCELSLNIILTLAARQFVSCNHQRAVEYFVYSINYKINAPVAYACKSWQDYLDGRCSDCGKDGKKCAVMGMRAAEYKRFKNDSSSVKMYLSTSGNAPFWRKFAILFFVK